MTPRCQSTIRDFRFTTCISCQNCPPNATVLRNRPQTATGGPELASFCLICTAVFQPTTGYPCLASFGAFVAVAPFRAAGPGIGFVLPKPRACLIHHNSFAARYLPVAEASGQLALFVQQGASHRPRGPGPTGQNWVRLARLCPSVGIIAQMPHAAHVWLCFARPSSLFRLKSAIINHQCRTRLGRGLPLPMLRVARIVPKFCAQTTDATGATSCSQRNREFFAPGAFCLLDCCINATVPRTSRERLSHHRGLDIPEKDAPGRL